MHYFIYISNIIIDVNGRLNYSKMNGLISLKRNGINGSAMD